MGSNLTGEIDQKCGGRKRSTEKKRKEKGKRKKAQIAPSSLHPSLKFKRPKLIYADGNE